MSNQDKNYPKIGTLCEPKWQINCWNSLDYAKPDNTRQQSEYIRELDAFIVLSEQIRTWEGDVSFMILTKNGIKYINRLYMNPINDHISKLSEA